MTIELSTQMKLIKITVLTLFATFVAVCVNYAHSNPIDSESWGELWKAPAWAGGCQLKAQDAGTEGGVIFSLPHTSRESFVGFWPNKAGEITITTDRETLTVTFKNKAAGQLEPVRYQLKVKGQLHPFECAGLSRVSP